VLHEDVYETRLGDGFFLHVHGIALYGDDARQLAALAGDSEWVKWHVSDEFRIDDFVAIISEIPPGGAASKLQTGMGRRENGPFIALPEK
jgi:hypothetical protein